MTLEGCSDDVDSNADRRRRLRSQWQLLRWWRRSHGSTAPSRQPPPKLCAQPSTAEYDTMQAKRQAIMSSNRLWSAEEKADYGQWPLILGDRRKADGWTLKDTIPLLKLPLYMPTENIVPFLTARAKGPIPRVTGGSDRPTIPYAEWERVIVKPRVPKKGDLMPRTEFTRQPDGNACGVFVCRTMETLVAAVAFQSELDWSWSPLKPLQDNFMLTNAHTCYTWLNMLACGVTRSWKQILTPPPPPLDLREGTGTPPPVPLGSSGIEISAPNLVLIDPSIGTIYTSGSNLDAQVTAPLISRSPRPSAAPSIATIGSMPDAPLMRLQRVVKYQTRTFAVRSIAAMSTSAPSPRRSMRKREESFFKAARLR
ncbi:BQ5605_C012g06987 [Microbotryum silenes-dioicae]|uniref:BQ5605_C012g06987 protein n=1 Tax=Microbotryum silenes-dioicae TaxID=796604 RepID=A0A2X0ME28_9BASI|nr:BQ5605_C012g06987 [Microbotryum silenes-dioicae]